MPLNIEKRIEDKKAKRVYEGNYEKATSIIPPVIKRYHNQNLQGYPYDPEMAKRLLDEAGYIDRNGDGRIREDKNGNPFTIKIGGVELKDSITGAAIPFENLMEGYIYDMWKK